MKRSTAVRHLIEIAEDCARANQRLEVLDSPIRIVNLWAYGSILDPDQPWGDQQQFSRAAAVVTLPEAEVPWLVRPQVLEWVAEMAGWHKRPVHLVWRSTEAPVWNHFLERPLLLWDASTGPASDAIEALRAGADLDAHRLGPPSEVELSRRLEREREMSFAALEAASVTYERKRWTRANHRELADQLWEAAAGFVDVDGALKARDRPED